MATLLLMTSLSTPVTYASDESTILERSLDAGNSFFHVGLWVEDMDAMLGFLAEVIELEVITRVARRDGGERVILSDPRGQLIELLSDPAKVIPHPEFPLHPVGRVAGVAHIAIHVDDAAGLREKLAARGYTILAQAPEDYAAGYIEAGSRKYRILFVEGPGAVTFELFEIR